VLSGAKIQERSNAIAMQRRRIEDGLVDVSGQLRQGAERLEQYLQAARNPGQLYAQATDKTRQRLNDVFYRRIYIDDDGQGIRAVCDDLEAPFDGIPEAQAVYAGARSQVTSCAG